MKLYLVRHGESKSSEMDPNQPLSPHGVKETEAVANLLKQCNIEIDEILHSTKARGKQTAEILGTALAPELIIFQHEALKPNDPIEPILDEIRSFDSNVMIVSHLPFLEKLLAALLSHATPIHLCSSTVICLEGEGRFWQILWVVSPKLLAV